MMTPMPASAVHRDAPVLEFWFDFASTYSYPAAMCLEALAAHARVRIAWRPFLLGPIFAQQGWRDSPFNIYPAKGRYMWRDLARVCQREGLPLRTPSRFPRNSLLAARVACAHALEPWLPAFVRATYRANFEHDLDIADPQVLSQCLGELGVDAAPVLARSQEPSAKEGLRAQTERAMELGIFGAPTFLCDDEMFWGYDRLELALEWCARRLHARAP